ncbi:right-handed parallel beta-helix repeat-containing protein [candidate division KSB1 bacterium]|nr:right-handed parallel beta-helix repeat-containing protein [candidate division KSB1 bacterium]
MIGNKKVIYNNQKTNKKFLNIRNLGLFIIPHILLIQIVSAATFYVSTNGSDFNNGSFKAPWRTIMYAVNNTRAGDIVLIRSGTYSPGGDGIYIRFDRGHGGALNAHWTLKAFPGETVFIKSRIIVEASFVRISGFHISGGNGIAIRCRDWGERRHRPKNVEILLNRFTGAGYRYGAIFCRADDCLIAGNTINVNQSSTLDHGIYLAAGKNNVIRGNIIKKVYGYGIHVYDEEKNFDFDHSFSNILIENNLITNSVKRCGILIGNGAKVTIDKVIIRNNIIVNNGNQADGIRIFNFGGLYIYHVRIYNNTIYNHLKAININPKNGIINHVFIQNNIFSLSKAGHIQAHRIKDFTVDHNLYWQTEFIGKGVCDKHATLGNPLFANVKNNDFSLRKYSPAINAGVDVGLAYSGSAPDLGALEYE